MKRADHFCAVDIFAAAVVVVVVIAVAFPFSPIRFWSALFHQHGCSFILVHERACDFIESGFFRPIFRLAKRKLVKIEWKIVIFFVVLAKPDKMQFAFGCFRHIINKWKEAMGKPLLPQTNSIKCLQFRIFVDYIFIAYDTFLNTSEGDIYSEISREAWRMCVL